MSWWAKAREASPLADRASLLKTIVRRGVHGSRFVHGGRIAFTHSTVIETIHHVTDGIKRGRQTATVTRWMGMVRRWVGNSAIRTWLVTPVETREITIDLGKTYTMAPLITLYQWLSPRAVAAFDRSDARTRFDEVADEIQFRPVEAVSIVFAAALVTNTVLSLGLHGLTRRELVLRVVALCLALVGSRIGRQ